MRKGSGIGFVAVLSTAAIVLILAARSWVSVAPAAQQVLHPGAAKKAKNGKAPGLGAGISNHGDPEAAAALADLPDLDDMKNATDKHAREVAQAVDESSH